jgi:hypothetical protein
MKWFVILLICAALGFAGYHYRDQIKDALGKSKPGSTESGTAGSPMGTKPEDVGPRPEPPKPEVKKPEIDPDIVEKFPLPKFKTLEELVGNWQNIPASAFPRAVTVNKAVDIIIAGGAGKTSLPAGSKASAIGISGDQLTVIKHIQAPDGTLVLSPTAPRGAINIDETDFKQVLGGIFDAWKKRKTNQVLAERKNAMREREDGSLASINPTSPSPSSPGTVARVPEPKSVDPKVGPRPEQESNGKVAVMLSSISDGDVHEIKINEIDRWGPIRYEIVGGEPYWTGTVSYTTDTLFGAIDTEAMALIRKGKVIEWVYTGSGEEVP